MTKIHLPRRALLAAVPALVAAPAIVRAQGSKPEKSLDCLTGFAAGSGFQPLAKNDKGCDDCCCLKIDRDNPSMTEGMREKVREEHRYCAINPCGTDPECNQREHVQAPVLEGTPCFLENESAGTENDDA